MWEEGIGGILGCLGIYGFLRRVEDERR